MDILTGLLGFVLVSTITPGPNNLLLAASGIQFGVRRTIPHVIGIHCGVYILVLLCGLGLGQILLAAPAAIVALKLFGSGYLLYLAWKILGFTPAQPNEQNGAQPMRILEGIIFQFSNPKAWMMAATGINISLGFDKGMVAAVLSLCLGFATLGLLCNFAWVWFGASLSGLLGKPIYRYAVNGGLACITLLTVALIWVA
ncbi:MAG: LysE family translocator [Halioglobus sp.]